MLKPAVIAKRAPMDHEGSGYARYGELSARGRRMTDEPVSKRVRNKDAESDRQRRLGMAEAALSGGAAYTGAKGVQDVRLTTKTIRGVLPRGIRASIQSKPVLDPFFHQGHGIVVGRKAGRLLATSGALGTAALGTAAYARGRRNRRWE